MLGGGLAVLQLAGVRCGDDDLAARHDGAAHAGHPLAAAAPQLAVGHARPQREQPHDLLNLLVEVRARAHPGGSVVHAGPVAARGARRVVRSVVVAVAVVLADVLAADSCGAVAAVGRVVAALLGRLILCPLGGLFA